MLRFIYADDLNHLPKLRDTMFRDRAAQFADRLGWEVKVDATGAERDQYDALNPLYVIWQQSDGSHGGSMRFLPTTGRTMVNEHFTHLTDGVHIQSPLIWECTRFCLSQTAGSQVSGALMLGGAELGLRFGLSHAVGVFDARMVRVYRALGWGPTIVGSAGKGRDAVSVGLWEFTSGIRDDLLTRTGISGQVSTGWLDSDFAVRPQLQVNA